MSTTTRAYGETCGYRHESVGMLCGGRRQDHERSYLDHPFTELPQPAPDAEGEWRVEDRGELGIDILDARDIVLRESFAGLPTAGAFREKHIARARAAAAQIVSDHTLAASVPKLVEALKELIAETEASYGGLTAASRRARAALTAVQIQEKQ